ncbi:DUF2809 domain-containing protein [Archangium violaceum]|uniref:ribosomal maturation YjgA family protein n=1 Tax=Archangium violaceum TaxID=83451 RepID=UPI001950C5C2|nr:DUF2809 domain-containing protein [Archangium violaceum]QRN98061.1 DUF2809 domain-containing protein [Archangium violaceum]
MSPGTPPAPEPLPPARGRLLLLPLMLLVIALGLGSRSAMAAAYLPRFFREYAGDTLWASMVYLCLLFALPRLRVRHAAAWALGISVLVELSQLLHTPWLDALRANRFGALLLGRGFVASDLVCYAAGVVLAAGTDLLWARWRRAMPPHPVSSGTQA